jgi:hypothetical protein
MPTHCANIILKTKKDSLTLQDIKSNYLITTGNFKICIKKNAYPKRIGISTIKTVYLLFSK